MTEIINEVKILSNRQKMRCFFDRSAFLLFHVLSFRFGTRDYASKC